MADTLARAFSRTKGRLAKHQSQDCDVSNEWRNGVEGSELTSRPFLPTHATAGRGVPFDGVDRITHDFFYDGVMLIWVVEVANISRQWVFRDREPEEKAIARCDVPLHVFGEACPMQDPEGEDPTPGDSVAWGLEGRAWDVLLPARVSDLSLCDSYDGPPNSRGDFSSCGIPGKPDPTADCT